MNKRLFIVAAILFFFSCKKNASTAAPLAPSITAMVNGAPLSFSVVPGATLGNPGNVWYLYFGGWQAATVPGIDIYIAGGLNPISAGTYPVTGHKVLLTYYTANAEYQNDTTSAIGQPVLTITSISFAGGVQGTFSGNLTSIPGSSPVSTVNITNGKFNVDIQP